MVTTFYPPYHFGGDGVYVYRLSEALAERGHSVDVIHSVDAYHLQHPAEPEIPFSHHQNVTRWPLDTKWPKLSALTAHQLGQPAAYARQLQHLLDGRRYDVIHFHNISLMGGPGVLRLGRAVKLCTTHEYWLICPTHILFRFNREACTQRKCLRCTLHARRPPQLWRYTRLVERCARHVDRFIIPSQFAMQRLRADGLDHPMTVIPTFVPMPSELADDDVAAHPNGEKPFFLFVGRLEKLKGVQDLIRLFADYREASLLIVGRGDFEPELRRQARGLPHVKFAGHVHPSEIGKLYRSAVAVLAPSLCYEVFALVPVEALAYGTPVVARRIGALTEVIEQSGAGFTFETLEECRHAMERLRCQRELRAELGERGRRFALENWTVENHMGQYLSLIESLTPPAAAGSVSKPVESPG